jgi:ribosomal 50S subunit-recycling heat shock protein
LQKARQIAKANIEKNQIKYKEQHDKKASPHDFSIGQKVWFKETNFLGKNQKLAPKWLGPVTIIGINESVAKIQVGKKVKKINVKRLKHFIEGEEKEQHLDEAQKTLDELIDFHEAGGQPGPVQDELIEKLINPPGRTTQTERQPRTIQERLIKDLINTPESTRPRTRAWAKLNKEEASIVVVDAEKEYKLNSIAYQLYHLNKTFEQLTPQDYLFWKSFDQRDIFQWLTGDQYRAPDYKTYTRIKASDAPGFNPPPAPAPINPAPAPPPPPPPPPPAEQEPKKRGRPLGSKNKSKDIFTRATHYASKRLTEAARFRAERAAGPSTTPPTAKRVTPAPP